MDHENPAGDGGLDLFGNPLVPLRDRRGRKSFKKDKENQDFVAVRAAVGWTHERIAEAIGCDAKTLRKHFSRELHQGQLIVEGLCLDVLVRRVREGHAPSIRQLLDRVDRVANPAEAGRRKKSEESEEAEAPKGKKEERLEEASRPEEGYGDLYDRIPRQ